MTELREMIEKLMKRANGQSYETAERKDETDILNSAVGSLTGYDCPICKNKGYIYRWLSGSDSEIVVTPCSCRRIRDMMKRIKESGLELMFEKYTFDRFDTDMDYQKYMKDLAIKYCQLEEKPFFFIGGQSGAGKTHLCTAIVRQMLEDGYTCRYMLWRDESSKIKAVANQPEYSIMLDEYKKTGLLYVDDLFKSQAGREPTAGDINLFFEIINYRYNEYLPTIISSEFNLSDICRFDEAIGSRISERCGRFVINLKKDSTKNQRMRSRRLAAE